MKKGPVSYDILISLIENRPPCMVIEPLWYFDPHHLKSRDRQGVNIPWIGGQNTMDRGLHIPLVGGPNTMGKWVFIPWIGGQNTMGRESIYYG